MSERTTSSYVIDVTNESFQRDVIEHSHSVPVVVDFWATWCGPCRVLGPILEKLAGEYGGKFLLAKVDIDSQSKLAIKFGVRSIPAIVGFRGGKAVDGFVGLQPEALIREWIKQLLPTPAETLAAQASLVEQSDPGEAEDKYNAAIALDPELTQAHIGLSRIALRQGRLKDAEAQIVELERRGFLEPEAEKIKAELTIQLQADRVGSIEEARTALAANPDDPARKFELAEALAATAQYDQALALCLELVERDRKGIGEKARRTMIAIFQLLPADSDLVAEYQRQLSLTLMD